MSWRPNVASYGTSWGWCANTSASLIQPNGTTVWHCDERTISKRARGANSCWLTSTTIWAESSILVGNFRRAERYARKGLQIRLRCVAAGDLTVASDRAALAAILDGLQRYGESKKLYNQALRTYCREYGPSHFEIAIILNNLGVLYAAIGRPKRAYLYYRSALEMKRREVGGSHPDVAVTMNNLATLQAAQGRPDLARIWFAKAIRLLDSSWGGAHPISRAVRRNQQIRGIRQSAYSREGARPHLV